MKKRHGFEVFRDTDDAERLKRIRRGGKVVVERPMAPAAQTVRWRTVRDMIAGGRIHLPDTDPGQKAARQLANLRATTLASGWLRVEGKQDDLADVVALMAEIASVLTPAADPADGVVERRYGAFHFDPREGITESGGGWVRRFGDGRIAPAEMPRWAPGFDAYARDMISRGIFTDAINDWLREASGKDNPTPDDVRRVLDAYSKRF